MSHLRSFKVVLSCLVLQCGSANAVWEDFVSSDGSTPTPRHEAASVVVGTKLYLMGGRGLRPIEILDTATNQWSIAANSNYEINHFQPVLWNGKIYAIAAFTGAFPHETNIPVIKIYDIASATWSDGVEIPEARRRGSAGAVVYNNKIYIHGGNTNGHDGGGVGWFDEYNPATNQWKVLADSPNARDHYSAAVVNGRFIAAGGRSTHYPNFLANKVGPVDSYNFATKSWETTMDNIPTERAGTGAVAFENEVVVVGGEASPSDAEKAVEALNVLTGKWRALDSLNTSRHGMGVGLVGNVLYAASGNETIGGGQELATTETLKLTSAPIDNADTDKDGLTDNDEINIHHTDKNKADTDGDSLSDGKEVNQHKTDPLKEDTDGDSLSDGDEINHHQTNPLKKDTDNDGIYDGAELNTHNTDPLKADTDADSLSDFSELNTHHSNPNLNDTDGDGLSDGEEVSLGTSPVLSDTDNDGISDADEVAAGSDPLDDSDPATEPEPEPAEPEPAEPEPAEPEPEKKKSGSGSFGGGLLLMVLLFWTRKVNSLKVSL